MEALHHTRSVTLPTGPRPAAVAGDPPDPHRWSSSVVLGVLVAAAGMAGSMALFPLLRPLPHPYWWIPDDVWLNLVAGHYVANGALPLIYESGMLGQSKLFVAGPLLPVLLAPVALISTHFHLSESYPLTIPKPSAWPVYGTYGLLLCSIPLLYATRSLAWELGIRRRPWVIQASAIALVLVPVGVMYGHYEDVLALAFVVLGVRDALRDKPIRAGLLFGVAVAFKQWALLGVPILVARAPAGSRLRTLWASIALPGGFVALALATDWPQASHALLWPPSFPRYGHAALWVARSAQIVTTSPFRLLAFVAAFALAFDIRRRRDPAALLAALGVAFLLRLAVEPVVYGYYLAPALALLLLHEATTTGGVRWTPLLGVAALASFALYPPLALWWMGLALLCACLAATAVRTLVAGPGSAARLRAVRASAAEGGIARARRSRP